MGGEVLFAGVGVCHVGDALGLKAGLGSDGYEVDRRFDAGSW